MAEQWTKDAISEKARAELDERYGSDAVDAVLTHMSDDIYDVISLMLARAADGGLSPLSREFASADLTRRRAEARMVQAEATMFETMSAQLATAGTSGVEAYSQTAEASAQLVGALAEKNSTMGEGNPHPGGTTVGPPDGGTPPPEETPTPPETPPATGEPEGCYERYRREITLHWQRKDDMDAITWWLVWGDLLNKLTLCAGPAAVKLLLDLLKAAKS